MAVYKVIQDIEAEDKLLGPLTLKGFVYAAIAGILAFINIKLLMASGPISIRLVVTLILLFPMFLFGVLASPLGREQPTEVWLLSRIKYFLKPRQRIWDQEGRSDLVTITAPKKKEANLAKDLSPTEVQSRLKTLALTLDTRGWAIKNVNVNASVPETGIITPQADSDRLVGAAGLPHEMPVVDVDAADDILDEQNNPVAQKFASLMHKADDKRRNGVLSAMKDVADKTTLIKPTKPKKSKSKRATAKAKLAGAGMTEDEEAFLKQTEHEVELEKELAEARSKFAKEHAAKKTLAKHYLERGAKPAEAKPQTKAKAQNQPVTPKTTPVTANRQAVNMELAQSGSAFSVATLSELANRQPKVEQTGPDEVTISLH